MGIVHAVTKSGRNVCNGGLQGHSIGQCFGASTKMTGPEHKHTRVTCKACIAKKAKVKQ